MIYTAYCSGKKIYVEANDLDHAAWRVGAYNYGDWKNPDTVRPSRKRTQDDGGVVFDILPKNEFVRFGSCTIFEGAIDDDWPTDETVQLNYSPVFAEKDREYMKEVARR